MLRQWTLIIAIVAVPIYAVAQVQSGVRSGVQRVCAAACRVVYRAACEADTIIHTTTITNLVPVIPIATAGGLQWCEVLAQFGIANLIHRHDCLDRSLGSDSGIPSIAHVAAGAFEFLTLIHVLDGQRDKALNFFGDDALKGEMAQQIDLKILIDTISVSVN